MNEGVRRGAFSSGVRCEIVGTSSGRMWMGQRWPSERGG